MIKLKHKETGKIIEVVHSIDVSEILRQGDHVKVDAGYVESKEVDKPKKLKKDGKPKEGDK